MEELVERFFNGDTTTAEEARLYRLFRRKRLPAELERMRPMFAAFASMQCEEPRRVAIMRTLRRAAIGTAAALAIALCLTLYANFREDRALARLYGGSYVIENGRRIDDLSSIREDIEQTLDDARRIESRTHHDFIDNAEQEAEQARLADFIDNAEQEVLDNITDPEMQKEVEQMLNE